MKCVLQFCYEAVVDVGLPTVSESLEINMFKSNSKSFKQIRVASKNAPFDRALNTVIDMRIPSVAKKVRSCYSSSSSYIV